MGLPRSNGIGASLIAEQPDLAQEAAALAETAGAAVKCLFEIVVKGSSAARWTVTSDAHKLVVDYVSVCTFVFPVCTHL